jgi:glycosyltransferase involved in cell wall biosynthesis
LATIREVLNEHNAYIVQPGDEGELARAIEHILSSPDEAVTKSTQALSDVGMYSWEQRAQRLIVFISKQ